MYHYEDVHRLFKWYTMEGTVPRQRKAPGNLRGRLPRGDRKRIRARLDELRTHAGPGDGTRYSRRAFFETRLRFNKSTVQPWFNPADDPRTPDVAACVTIAQEADVSLDWLLLGRGARRYGVPVMERSAESALRTAAIEGAMSGGLSSEQADTLVGDGTDVLDMVRYHYQRVAQMRGPELLFFEAGNIKALDETADAYMEQMKRAEASYFAADSLRWRLAAAR